jgi:hypothetical protein
VVISPITITVRDGKWPSQRRAPKAGVHISSRPWGVLERAQNSFSRENPVNELWSDVSDTWLTLRQLLPEFCMKINEKYKY